MPTVTIMDVRGGGRPYQATTVTDHLFEQAPDSKLCVCGNPRGFHTMRAEATPNVVGQAVVDEEHEDDA